MTQRLWKQIVGPLLMFVATPLLGVSNPATLHRACLDRPSFTLTVSLSPPSDVCGSFQYHRLYGREDAVSPWKMLKEIPILNISNVITTLPNTKQWEVYLMTSFACSTADSFISNRIKVDNQAPAQFEPDSVSIEFTTQQVVAGWTQPNDTDIMGYSLFKFSGGGNVLLTDTFTTFYRFLTSVFNPLANTNSFSIAAFDSCLNGGLLSNYHAPMNLIVQKDSRFWCNKKTTLLWIKYRGWETEKYSVWRYCVTDKTWDLLTEQMADLVNDPFNYIFTDINYDINKQYKYIIRAHQKNKNVSSTSNAVDIDYTYNGVIGPISLITRTSVVAPNQIKIDGNWKQDGPASTLTIQKRTSNSWLTLQVFSQPGQISHTDITSQTQNTFSEYRLIRKNECGFYDDSCSVNNSMLISSNQRVVSWNLYKGWSVPYLTTDFAYTLENKVGSTWNSISTTTQNTFTLPANITGKTTLRLKIYSTDGKLPLDYEAYSNEHIVYLDFDSTIKDTTLIPSAFNPSGINTHFLITNPSIALGDAVMTIYNRWGELLFSGDALLGWNGDDPNKTPVPQGVYVYLIQSYHRNKKSSYSGTLLLVK